MDFALNFLNMSPPFGDEYGPNQTYVYDPVNNKDKSTTSHADEKGAHNSVILVMLIVLIIWRRCEWTML